MDRLQFLLVGLPLYLFCSDLFLLFSPPPPKPLPHHQSTPTIIQPTPDFPSQKSSDIGGIGLANGNGNTIKIDYCSSCSYRGTAAKMKTMLETSFPGVSVALENYPPPLPKRLLAKVVPVVQFGVIGIVMGGERIFPMLGITTPPPWYYTLRANRFGTMSTTWLLGNFLQSFLQSSGAFEVYFNGEKVFSKLKERRFPGEIELKDLIGQRMASFL